MKYFFSVFVALLFNGCGNNSLLSGKTLYFNSKDDTVTLDSSGSYIETNPVCNDSGTWKDLNSGNTSGTVCFEVSTSNCVPNYQGDTISYSYVIAGNLVDVSNPQLNPSDCN